MCQFIQTFFITDLSSPNQSNQLIQSYLVELLHPLLLLQHLQHLVYWVLGVRHSPRVDGVNTTSVYFIHPFGGFRFPPRDNLTLLPASVHLKVKIAQPQIQTRRFE